MVVMQSSFADISAISHHQMRNVSSIFSQASTSAWSRNSVLELTCS